MPLLEVLAAKLAGKPIALCDASDVDGIASAALFKRAHPNGHVELMGPSDVKKKWWVKLIEWDFVADLPCPGKAKIRADHHKTNKPCAQTEFYDPEAPASAVLAAKALGLEDDDVARQLVEAAVQTDTANVTDPKIRLLDLAVRYASDSERIVAVEKLALKGLAALDEEPLRSMAERGVERDRLVAQIANSIPTEERLFIYSPTKLGISYRVLAIELEKKGARFVNILVRRGWRTYRLYCGAHRDGPYDCTEVATRLGGGGHKYAAGALFKAPLLNPLKPLFDLAQQLKPSVVYVLGSCNNLKLPCRSIEVMSRGSNEQ
jgi:Exopolyphosphatase-related proteins